MTELVTECRRCSECDGYSHHWMPQPIDEFKPEYCCKHCDARGTECNACEGTGRENGTLFEVVEDRDYPNCPTCDGEGVTFVEFARYEREDWD